MKTSNDKAFKRVYKKLAAVRATLPNDEREVLDEIVTTAPEEAEVEGHKMAQGEASASRGATNKTAKRQVQAHGIRPTAPAKTNAKQGAKAQVRAHRISPAAPTKASAKQSARAQVKAHRISPAAPTKASAKQSARAQVKAHRISPAAPTKASAKQTVKSTAKDE